MTDFYRVFCKWMGNKFYITYPSCKDGILSKLKIQSNLYREIQAKTAAEMATKLFMVKFEIELAQGL